MVSIGKRNLLNAVFRKALPWDHYSTYINHLANALENCVVHHFADDINLICKDKEPSEISHVITNELR